MNPQGADMTAESAPTRGRARNHASRQGANGAREVVIIDKHTPPSERTDENVLAALAIFERTGRDSIAGNKRAEFEAEAVKRGLR